MRILIAALMLTATAIGVSYADSSTRDKVKAVFIYKFFDYVSWPDGRNPGENIPAVVCIIGSITFSNVLAEVGKIKQESLGNEQRHITSIRQADKCHILLMSSAYSPYLSKVPATVLTVSDSKSFAKSGGMIELRDTRDKMELIINHKVAQESKLKINAGLLNIAEVIR